MWENKTEFYVTKMLSWFVIFWIQKIEHFILFWRIYK